MLESLISPVWRVLLQIGHATTYGLALALTAGRVCVEDPPFRIVALRRTPRGFVLGGYFSAVLGLVLWVWIIRALVELLD